MDEVQRMQFPSIEMLTPYLIMTLLVSGAAFATAYALLRIGGNVRYLMIFFVSMFLGGALFAVITKKLSEAVVDLSSLRSYSAILFALSVGLSIITFNEHDDKKRAPGK